MFFLTAIISFSLFTSSFARYNTSADDKKTISIKVDEKDLRVVPEAIYYGTTPENSKKEWIILVRIAGTDQEKKLLLRTIDEWYVDEKKEEELEIMELVGTRGKTREHSHIKTNNAIRVLYTNYRGVTAIRNIVPLSLSFGATEWHTTEQWLLKVWDCDRAAERVYALRDIKQWFVEEAE